MKFKILITGLLFTFFNVKAQNTSLYVGTYTNGDSEGIYRLQFNTETGELSQKELAITTENPSFITFSKNKKLIYGVSEGTTSAVTAFKIKANGKLEVLNTKSSNGKGPCHVSLNKNSTKAVVSNYGAGTFSIYNLNKDGSLNKASQVFDHNSETKKSHAHSAQFYKNDLFVSDLGRNRLYQYKLETDSYKLKSPTIVEMKDNPGPRHFSISKNGKFIYIINEYGSSITSVKKTKKGFKQIDYDSTLDENYDGENSCADIHLSQDERFLYGSNRGENSIAVFKRNKKKGTLDKIQNISVHGDWPRNFTLDPSGKFILVANKKSNNISVFKINLDNGKLTFLNDSPVPAPVCLLF
ncbi:lactonase family protein [Algibacter sp. L1A34]|uniref:lactonase family protein n=1 Tax=Algibacter sp. L1A34 TaxID=2686365 RepID=UPI00131EB5AA|nr:lactonase family protein [Algibacter sp. L1A34]